MSPLASIDLPLDIERATLHTSIYLIFQPIRRTAKHVATPTGELLPHLFTLILQKQNGYFLLRYFDLTTDFPLRSMVLCVARTFLFSFKKKKRQTILLFYKGKSNEKL